MRFQIVSLAVFLLIGGAFVVFTQRTHLEREAQNRAKREAEILATAEELRRKREQPELPFQVEETELRAEGEEHWLLELRLRYRNEGERSVLLEPPLASLVTADGEPVPEFFLALAPRPRVNPGSEEAVSLRYWLDRELKNQPLWLEIGGDRMELQL